MNPKRKEANAAPGTTDDIAPSRVFRVGEPDAHQADGLSVTEIVGTVAKAICKSGKFECGQGCCAPICMAYAAAADAADARDKSLAAFAEGVVQILISMKAPGCEWLDFGRAA